MTKMPRRESTVNPRTRVQSLEKAFLVERLDQLTQVVLYCLSLVIHTTPNGSCHERTAHDVEPQLSDVPVTG
jgi:hypothetical protein